MHTMNDFEAVLREQGGHSYLGLAPFLRASIAGTDLRQATQQLLQKLADDSRNPQLLMNLSVAAQCLNQRALGLAFQKEALALQRTYTIPARVPPARLRLLVLVSEGSIQSNTPLECLLEDSDIELVFHYVCLSEQVLANAPAHDLLFVGISDSDANRDLLQALEVRLEDWPQPVLNSPRYLPFTGRDRASSLLQGVPGLLAPVTRRVARAQLQALADGLMPVAALLPGCSFPVIVRPLGSQAGVDLQRIAGPSNLRTYLAALPEETFFVAPFVDYSDASGLFRKIRIALINGKPFVCHMAVSSHWMIHYVNAGMYEDHWKSDEEARFMADFAQFVQKHQPALDAIGQRMQLEYLVMDCAESRGGELLLFEIDHGGVVHAMDVESLFPYKNAYIHKAKRAFSALLYSLLPRGAPRLTALAAPAPRGHTPLSPNQLNFSGGPGALPACVLSVIQQAIQEVPGTRLSLLGISHRSDWFASVVTELEGNVRTLLGLGKNYHVLMLQGGATQQFSMVPMTLLRGTQRTAEYLQTGYWSSKPILQARREGAVKVLWTGQDSGFVRLPTDAELAFSTDAAYLHYVSNETVEGLQFHRVLGHNDVPRVCDMSSDFLSRPCEAERFSIIYAHAQKNIGPAGVTMVLLKDTVLEGANVDLPDFLNYRTQIDTHSNFNTPPVFSIYVTLLVTRWLLQQVGGLERMHAINQQKAGKIYRFLDSSEGFYQGRANPGDRSLMNAVFQLPTARLEQQFLAESSAAGFSGLGGHRAIGGIRASVYNALSVEAVERLLGFMAEFQHKNQS
jgi:phosphoserine aminotransferase